MRIGDWLSLVGLAIAIVQIQRAGSVARAIKRTVDRIAARISLYNILLVVPELSRVDAELESAVIKGDEEAVRRLLKAWRELASDLRGLLEGHSLESAELLKQIQLSLTHVNQAKTQLLVRPEDMLAGTERARAAIDTVCQEARFLAGRIRVLTDEAPESLKSAMSKPKPKTESKAVSE